MSDQQTFPQVRQDSSPALVDEKPVEATSAFRHSATISKIAEALAKASGEFATPKKTSDNPFFKSAYADMAELIEATRPALSKHGLSVLQFPGKLVVTPEGWRVEITTMLLHASGEWFRGESEMPCAKRDAQGLGSAETYGRRYAYQAILSLAALDDDGNEATGKHIRTEAEEKQYEADFDQRTEGQQCLVPYQMKAIEDGMKATGKTEAELKAYLELAGYKRLEHVLKSDFEKLRLWAIATSKPKSKMEIKKAAPESAIYTTVVKTKPEGHNWPALFAKARNKGYTEADVKDYYCKTYGVTSGKELSAAQFAETMQKVELWIEITA